MIPQKIEELRSRLGLTQEALARRLGISFATVNRWANGRSKPSPLALKKLKAIARKAGVEIEDPKPRLRLNRRRK